MLSARSLLRPGVTESIVEDGDISISAELKDTGEWLLHLKPLPKFTPSTFKRLLDHLNNIKKEMSKYTSTLYVTSDLDSPKISKFQALMGFVPDTVYRFSDNQEVLISTLDLKDNGL